MTTWNSAGAGRAWYLALVLALGALASATTAATAQAAPSALCVDTKPKCFPTLQAALAAAHDGDAIKVGPGTWAGGVTIDKNVTLMGAGAGKTTIRGGGPVVTVGVYRADSQPTVTLRGLTITGGVTTTSPEALDFFGKDGVNSLGGGIAVEPNSDFSGGATLTIVDSVVTGNRSDPAATFVPTDPWWPQCAAGPCPVALVTGGGISDAGAVTLVGTTVSGNQVGSASGLASMAFGAGIETTTGSSLTLEKSTVNDNVAVVGGSHGWFAQGAGIYLEPGAASLTVRNSTVSGNHSTLTSTIPSPYPTLLGENNIASANTGGISVGDGTPVLIDHSHIDGNTVSATNVVGAPSAYDAGIRVGDSPLVMRDSTVSGNSVDAVTKTQSDLGPGGSDLEFDGPARITNTEVTDNTSTAFSPDGVAGTSGAVLAFDEESEPAVIRNSTISGNTMIATTLTGSATVDGGGLVNGGPLNLIDVRVTGNTGTIHGPDGNGVAGGVLNFGQLSLEHSSIDHNRLSGDPGLPLQGGGLYSCGSPYTLSHSQIVANVPDQIAACASPLAPFTASAPALRGRNRELRLR